MPSKYWTAFCYEDFHPSSLHCTHKYFGPQSKSNVSKIFCIISEYFERNPYVSFQPRFDKPELFGGIKKIKVLTTQHPLTDFYLNLKHSLDAFRDDDWPDYRPHVSTNRHWECVDMMLVYYALIKDDQILNIWSG